VFGVGGGGLVGYKYNKKLKDLTEFEFERVEVTSPGDEEDQKASSSSSSSRHGNGGGDRKRSSSQERDTRAVVSKSEREEDDDASTGIVITINGWLIKQKDGSRATLAPWQFLVKDTRALADEEEGAVEEGEEGEEEMAGSVDSVDSFRVTVPLVNGEEDLSRPITAHPPLDLSPSHTQEEEERPQPSNATYTLKWESTVLLEFGTAMSDFLAKQGMCSVRRVLVVCCSMYDIGVVMNMSRSQ
jgi:hypothetical protein